RERAAGRPLLWHAAPSPSPPPLPAPEGRAPVLRPGGARAIAARPGATWRGKAGGSVGRGRLARGRRVVARRDQPPLLRRHARRRLPAHALFGSQRRDLVGATWLTLTGQASGRPSGGWAAAN